MFSHILIYYGEIGLKGDNRDFFEGQLIKNIKTSQAGNFFDSVNRFSGRILVKLKDKVDINEIVDILKFVYGIEYIMPVIETEQTFDAMKKTVLTTIKDSDFKTFGVRARRQNKIYKFSSKEIEQQIGSVIFEFRDNLKVDLENPEQWIYVSIIEKKAYIGLKKFACFQGLPTGVSGSVLCLLSGGIDSPVAASLMQKRGCVVDCVHFHNMPHASTASADKVKGLFSILKKYQSGGRLFLIPLTEIQKEIVKNCEQRYRVLLYRRAMLKISECIARKEKIFALVTGDSIGQVASQTIENLTAVDSVVNITVFRPLSGMDKSEIVELARKIGTYEESILPHEDCCTYFQPHHPATKSTAQILEKQEQKYDLDLLISHAIDNIEIIE